MKHKIYSDTQIENNNDNYIKLIKELTNYLRILILSNMSNKKMMDKAIEFNEFLKKEKEEQEREEKEKEEEREEQEREEEEEKEEQEREEQEKEEEREEEKEEEREEQEREEEEEKEEEEEREEQEREEEEEKEEEEEREEQEKDFINNKNEKIFKCRKCNKTYKTNKYLIGHEEKCKGLNILTCPRCMKTFSSSGNKCKHIKNNNCKARSIYYAIKPDKNDYGCERIDYITLEDMINILTKNGNNIIPKYIEIKYFNKDFPENNNIKYEKNNYLIRKNGIWITTNMSYLLNDLIYKNGIEINKYLINNNNIIKEKIKNIEQLDYIYKRCNYLDLNTNKELHNNVKCEIKNIIKSNIYIN